MPSPQDLFLVKAATAAAAAGHIFPEYAACEAALESAWGGSQLATQANNLFGQKQSHPPLPGSTTLNLPTHEVVNGVSVPTEAQWVVFPDWSSCFKARMALLQRLASAYPDYQTALNATTGEQFVTAVSHTWSTDPQRGAKVLAIYNAHSSAFTTTPAQS